MNVRTETLQHMKEMDVNNSDKGCLMQVKVEQDDINSSSWPLRKAKVDEEDSDGNHHISKRIKTEILQSYQNNDNSVIGEEDLKLPESYSYAFQHQNDEILMLNDEDYAFQLHLQETLKTTSLPSTQNPLQIQNLYGLNNNFNGGLSKAVEVEVLEHVEDKVLDVFSKAVKVEALERVEHQVLDVCIICLESKGASELFYGIACTHRYCKACISLYIQTKVSDKSHAISCPQPDCNVQLSFEICQSFVPNKTLEKWSDTLAEAAIPDFQKFYCPYKDCSALLQNDCVQDMGSSSLINDVLRKSDCPICKRLFCVHCKVAWHEGLDCSEIESLPTQEREREDIKLFKLVKENEWQRCAKCRRVIERITGCTQIVCMCGYQFCYDCGAEWNGGNNGIPCDCSGWKELRKILLNSKS